MAQTSRMKVLLLAFGPEMVCANRAGRKSMTRRLVRLHARSAMQEQEHRVRGIGALDEHALRNAADLNRHALRDAAGNDAAPSVAQRVRATGADGEEPGDADGKQGEDKQKGGYHDAHVIHPPRAAGWKWPP
jgi:hypothetical protein